MRGFVCVFAILMLGTICNAQDWIVEDGVEYNCSVIRSIVDEFGDEPLTRQPRSLQSVEYYLETVFPACQDPLADIPTVVADAIQTEDDEHTPDTSAESEGEDCYPHDSAYARTRIRIRNEASYVGRNIGYTKPNEPVQITRSVLKGGNCWLRTARGWILHSPLLSPAEPSTGLASELVSESTVLFT